MAGLIYAPAHPYPSSMSRPAFTTIELIIAVAIFAVSAAAAVPFAGNYLTAVTVSGMEQDVVQVLRRAQGRAQAAHYGSAWGVRFGDHSYTLFAGESYAARIADHDQIRIVDDAYVFGGADEIVFRKTTGIPMAAGSVTLSYRQEETAITVSSAGTISVE